MTIWNDINCLKKKEIGTKCVGIVCGKESRSVSRSNYIIAQPVCDTVQPENRAMKLHRKSAQTVHKINSPRKAPRGKQSTPKRQKETQLNQSAAQKKLSRKRTKFMLQKEEQNSIPVQEKTEAQPH